MNYHDTVISNLLLYPGLFPSRLEVDNHLFAVIGNGYEWVDGELIEIVYNPDRKGIDELNPYDAIKKHITSEFLESSSGLKKQIEINELLKRDSPLDLALTRKVNNILKMIDMTENVGERYNTYCHIPDNIELSIIKRCGEERSWRIYEISKYSALVNFPEDIKPDWKEALYNFILWCLENQSYLCKNSIDKQLEHLRNSKNRLEKL